MEITKKQLTSIIKNAPIGTNQRSLVEGLIQKGHTIEGIDPLTTSVFREQQKQASQIAGNQFEPEQPKSLWGKAKDIASTIIGGGELARGAGLALAAPGVQKSLAEAQNNLISTQTDLLQRLKAERENGEDVSKTINLLKLNQLELERIGDANQDFAESVPTTKQVVGSATRLAGTLAGGALAKGVGNLFGVGKAITTAGGAVRGLGAGVTGGAIEGGIQGAGFAAEENKGTKEILESGAIGAGVGGLAGGLVGTVAGGLAGRFSNAGSLQRKMDLITPEGTDITPTEYQRLLSKGRIEPPTATSPARYIFSQSEAQTAEKYSDLIKKNPAKTVINIGEKIGDLDNEVGTFLKQNNGIFNKGELKNQLADSMEDITDLTVSEDRLLRAKEQLINGFVDQLEKNDMESLWLARKQFDQQAGKIFSGSPSLQKEVKRALRNAVQNFIAERTPEGVYKGYMKDMTNLFDLQDLVSSKATKERSRNLISQWAKDNPTKAKIIGYGGGAVLAQQLLQRFNPFSSGSSQD